MPIQATCPKCFQSYNAPESLAGKSVRCKGCGTVFKLEVHLDSDVPDLAGLEDSLSETVSQHASQAGTRAGTPRIERTSGMGEALASAPAMAGRANLRFSYPGAKQVDQLLPIVLAIGGPLVVAMILFNYSSSPGLALSRFATAMIAYIALVWPAAHVGLSKASGALAFQFPKQAALRSFAALMPALVFAILLWALGGGGLSGLIIGVIVGLIVSLGTIFLLFRVFPNELPITAAYAAGGAILGTAIAGGIVFGLNSAASTVASSIASQSPFGIGMDWPAPQDVPVRTASAKPKPKAGGATAAPTPSDTGKPASPDDAQVDPAGAAGQALPASLIPVPLSSDQKLYRWVLGVYQTPVPTGYVALGLESSERKLIAVEVPTDGTRIDVWDTVAWTRLGRTKPFSKQSVGQVTVMPTGTVARYAENPRPGVELMSIASSTNDTFKPLKVTEGRTTRFVGFTDANRLVMRQDDLQEATSFVVLDTTSGQTTPIELGERCSVRIAAESNTLLTLGGDALIGVGQSTTQNSAILFGRRLSGSSATEIRTVPGEGTRQYIRGLAASSDGGRVALLTEAAGELIVTMWDMFPAQRNGTMLMPRRSGPTLEKNLGLRNQFDARGDFRDGGSAVLWIDDRTLLVFGDTLVDSTTGAILGRLGVVRVQSAMVVGMDGILCTVRDGDDGNAPSRAIYVQLNREQLDAERK